MVVLHAVEGPLRGRIFSIPEKPRLIVGRYEIYDVVVPEPSISRKHFVLERRPDGIYIIDLGSLNGTQLNGQRISTAKLDHGDLITAGQSVLCYDETDSPTPPVTAAQRGDIQMPPDVPAADVAAVPAVDSGADEPPEEISDADIVESAPEVESAPTDEIAELPDEVPEVPEEIVELPDELPEEIPEEPLDAIPDEPPEEAPAEVVELPDLETLPDLAAAAEPPPTVPMDTSVAREAIRKRRLRTDIGKRRATRAAQKEEAARAAGEVEAGPSDSRRGSGRRRSGRRPGPDLASPPPVASGPAVDKCVACGRAVSQEEIDAGEGAKTRKGYLCGHCVEERQKSGNKGLEKFIRYVRRQKRG